MKRSYLAFCAAVIITACNNSPKTDTTTIQKSNTEGLAEFEAMKAQQAADSIELRDQKAAAEKQALVAPAAHSTTHKSSTSSSRSSSASSGGSGSASSESSNTASSKKGWSKTAKGAVIGG